MSPFFFRRAQIGFGVALVFVGIVPAWAGTQSEITRGRYLARITGCIGCHTPRTPNGDVVEARLMSGGDHPIAGNLGRFFPPNVTPDKATGLGDWTAEEIARAVKTGRTPDGRVLSTAMPWRTQFDNLTDTDALAIASYLKSLPPIRNAVPPPIPASGK